MACRLMMNFTSSEGNAMCLTCTKSNTTEVSSILSHLIDLELRSSYFYEFRIIFLFSVPSGKKFGFTDLVKLHSVAVLCVAFLNEHIYEFYPVIFQSTLSVCLSVDLQSSCLFMCYNSILFSLYNSIATGTYSKLIFLVECNYCVFVKLLIRIPV